MVPGGQVRHGEQSFVGPAAERTLSDYRFDTYVMTASAVEAGTGFTEWNVDDAAIKRAALASSGAVHRGLRLPQVRFRPRSPGSPAWTRST